MSPGAQKNEVTQSTKKQPNVKSLKMPTNFPKPEEHVIVNTKNNIQIFGSPPSLNQNCFTIEESSETSLIFSEHYLVYANRNELIVYECTKKVKRNPPPQEPQSKDEQSKLFMKDPFIKEKFRINQADVEKILISPMEQYIVTLSRYLGSGQKGNLAIWSMKDGSEVYRGSHQEHATLQQWPKIVMFYTFKVQAKSDKSTVNKESNSESQTDTQPKEEVASNELSPNGNEDSSKGSKKNEDSTNQPKKHEDSTNQPKQNGKDDSTTEPKQNEKDESNETYIEVEICGIYNERSIIFLQQASDGSMKLERKSKYHQKKVRFWSLGSKGYFIVYCDGKGSAPGGLYLYPSFGSFKKPISNINFQNIEYCDIQWNSRGDQALITTTSQADDSTYYGISRLYLMSAKGKYQSAVAVESPVHDAKWSPKGSEFIAIYGTTPNCKATLYNQRGQAVVQLGVGPRNTIRWNPQASIFCLAGIRTMQGRLEFWSREKKKIIGIGQASEASQIEWSPSGRYFMSATVTPIMHQSNKIQIFKYNGVLKTQKKFETPSNALYHAEWQNYSPDLYPEVKPSPRAMNEATQTKQQQTQVSKKYVPPHLRRQ